MAVNIVVPELGESVIEATVRRWLKKPGERVAAGEAVVELETEKVNLEVGVEKAGVLARIEHPEGEDVHVGDVLGVIEAAAEAEPAATPAPTAQPTSAATAPQGDKQASSAGKAPAEPEPARAAPPPAGTATVTPVARRMAEAAGLDLSRVQPSGPGNKVTKDDVRAYLEQRPPRAPEAPSQPVAAQVQEPAPQPAPDGGAAAGRREDRVRLSRRRRTIARRLVEAQQTAAMLTTFNEIDMSAVVDLRQRRKAAFKEQHGVGLGFMSFFVKGSIGALRAFPTLNAELQGDDLVLKRYYDIGIAVGAEEGLVVPVLRDADRMSFAEIERQIEAFARKAREAALTLDDLRGGTFTITNGGVFGSLLSTPILNPPQVGILGLHKIEERPIARNGEVVIRPMMYVALSYDHRVVDGREAVQFLVRVKQLVEDPESLLLEG